MAASGPIDGPWVLPNGWRWNRLGSVANRISAKHLPDPASTIPFVGMDAIAPHSMVVTATQPFGSMRSAASAFAQGDVLYGRLRPYLNKVWRATFGGACSGELIVIRPSAELDAAYLTYLLHGHDFVDFASHAVAGDRPRIDFATISEFPVPLPPLDVQKVIAARIDELFAEIDDGQAALGRAREDLGTWRKALLKGAVAGELTVDWRAAHPPTDSGADLLARILADRRAHWGDDVRNAGKRYADAGEPVLGELPDLPASWTWAGIEQLTTGGIRNGLSLKEAAGPTAVKGLRLDALQSDGIDWTRTRHLPIDLDRAAPYLLRAGDLLISRANGSPEFVGRCTMVDQGRDDTVFPDTAIRYPIVDEPRLRTWAKLAWSAPQSRKRMLALAKSTAGILKISQSDIAAVGLPLPPLAEIDEIVARVGGLSADAEAGADDLAAMKLLPSTLRQSILAAAFRGELA